MNMSEKTEIKEEQGPSQSVSCLSRSPCVCQLNSIQVGFTGMVFNKALQCSLKTIIVAIMIRKENV